MLDTILNKFFVTVGGEPFILGIVGLFLAFVIVISLIDSIIDL